MDGGMDNRFNETSVGNGFKSIITDQHLQPLLTGWYLTEDLYPESILEEGIFITIIFYYLLYTNKAF
jgi:hypothetical protein